jgi:hypothetical protein
MFTAGKDCPVIAVAQTSSRAGSAAAWAIYAQGVSDSWELVMTFGAIRAPGSPEAGARVSPIGQHDNHSVSIENFPRIKERHSDSAKKTRATCGI